jgi:hypothetical protein
MSEEAERTIMDRLDQLEAIAQIRVLKARYWRGVDSKDAALLRSVFTDDVEIDFQGAMGGPDNDPAMVWHGADTFVADTMGAVANVTTVHHGFEPEIEILSESEAVAIWPVQDTAWVSEQSDIMPFTKFTGYGQYHHRFRKVGTEWKIAKIRLTRCRIETE